MGTQAEETGRNAGSFKIQVNELIHNDKMRSYGNKSNHKQHQEEKSHDHEHHEGMKHEGHKPSGGKNHGNHHTHMLKDFRSRFIVSFVLTIPVLLLSPTIQGFFGLELHVPGADFITFLLSSIVYFYGGYPFFQGIKEEFAEKTPGNDFNNNCHQYGLFL